jgi:predicted GTPase
MATGITEGIRVGHRLESCTTEVQSVKLLHLDMNVVLVDTPGFDDTHKSDVDILKMIADWLKCT